jgi:hypothetical protein
MQSVIDQVKSVREYSPDAEIQDALNKIAENKTDPGIRKHFLHLLNNERMEDQVEINLYAAGIFGICLGGKYMLAGNPGEYQVHPFLHKLRKGILGCPELRGLVKENSRKYVFYTEFYESIWNLRARIAAVAKAHAGADYGNDLLTVLYSLGGFFSKTESEVGLRDAKGAGGTTCVMTARGIYHAAGACMIGEKDPTVNTPGGPQLELGVPTNRTATNSNKKITTATTMRDDQYSRGPRGFDKDDREERNRPRLEQGDIYYVDGAGEFKFLLRKGAVAAHVGVVVDIVGDAVSTVDGGSGTGAKIDLNANRKVKYVKNLGWTLDRAGKSFTPDNIDEVETYMAGFRTADAVIAWLKQNPKVGRAYLDQIARAEKDIAKAINNPKLIGMLEKAKQSSIENARRLIKESKKSASASNLGQDRVLKGWWKPVHYSELRYVGRENLKSWLAAS